MLVPFHQSPVLQFGIRQCFRFEYTIKVCIVKTSNDVWIEKKPHNILFIHFNILNNSTKSLWDKK